MTRVVLDVTAEELRHLMRAVADEHYRYSEITDHPIARAMERVYRQLEATDHGVENDRNGQEVQS